MSWSEMGTNMVRSSPILDFDSLVSESISHVKFLKKLHKLGVSLERPSSVSLHRYFHLWLPLLARETQSGRPESQGLLPPPDVAWLFHCHRLTPKKYEEYVLRHFGRIVEDPEGAFDMQESSDDSRPKASMTRQLWQKRYPAEPFFPADEHKAGLFSGETRSAPSKTTEEDSFQQLANVAERQASFLWQVSGSKYQNPWFLLEGAQNYVKFLQLARSASFPLVPTYVIDLIWHTHIVKSIKTYNRDCVAICGQRFHHDTSLLSDDRSEGAALDQSFRKTSALWKEKYGTSYAVAGGMYRGEAPGDFWNSDWDSNSSLNKIHICLAGSSSAGTTDVPQTWLSCNDASKIADQPTFIRASSKNQRALSTVLNLDGRKIDYIFGTPSKLQATGYYHISTREGFQILIQRLKRRHMSARSSYEGYIANQCLCWPTKKLKPHQLRRYEELKKYYEDSKNYLAFAKAVYASDGPGTIPLENEIIKYGGTKLPDDVFGGTPSDYLNTLCSAAVQNE